MLYMNKLENVTSTPSCFAFCECFVVVFLIFIKTIRPMKLIDCSLDPTSEFSTLDDNRTRGVEAGDWSSRFRHCYSWSSMRIRSFSLVPACPKSFWFCTISKDDSYWQEMSCSAPVPATRAWQDLVEQKFAIVEKFCQERYTVILLRLAITFLFTYVMEFSISCCCICFMKVS